MTQETTGDIVDDVISQKDVDAVFSPEIDVTPEPPVQPAPQPQPEGAPLPEGLPDNDQVRYAYWQSQADKKDNRIKELEGTVGTLQSAFQTVAPQQEAVKEPEVEKFPDPPEKPQRPRNFSRQEAMEDAGSESARYMDEIDDWRDNIDEYNRLRTDYDRSIIEQEREQFQTEQRARQEAMEAEVEQRNQLDTLRTDLKSRFGAVDNDIDDFIAKMSDPESLSVENLWRLHQLNKGQVPQPVMTEPSSEFQQVQRAQQVPSPMGVQSAANTQASGKDPADLIMDDLISDYKKQNPWGN